MQLTPQLGQHGICPLAEQNMLGNDINAILLEYGVGDAGVDTGAIFLAGVCTVPTITNRRRLGSVATGFLWTGVGGCRKGTCNPDNSDQRMLVGVGAMSTVTEILLLLARGFQTHSSLSSKRHWKKPSRRNLFQSTQPAWASDPAIAVTVNGITRAQLLAVECASSDIGVLDTMSFANLAISSRMSVCSKCVKIDFSSQRKWHSA